MAKSKGGRPGGGSLILMMPSMAASGARRAGGFARRSASNVGNFAKRQGGRAKAALGREGKGFLDADTSVVGTIVGVTTDCLGGAAGKVATIATTDTATKWDDRLRTGVKLVIGGLVSRWGIKKRRLGVVRFAAAWNGETAAQGLQDLADAVGKR